MIEAYSGKGNGTMWKQWITNAGETEDFDWDFGTCACISLVGGGGKTTLMDCWARELTARRQNVLVTTSTHLQLPQGTVAFSLGDVHRLWMDGNYAVLGTPRNGKLSPPDEALLEQAMEQSDVTFVEADGSKCRPCKVPNASEPVLREETEAVAAVLGMSAVGAPIAEKCFRLDELEVFLGKSRDEILTEEDAALILSSRQGSRKDAEDLPYFVVLNQCDTAEKRRSARRIAQMLLDRGVEHVLLTHFDEEERNRFERGISDE